MIKILGISGKRESGKSTLANHLEPFGFVRVSLATPLKEMCKLEYGLTDDQVYGTAKEVPTKYQRTDGSFFTPRDILIREGCLKRSINPDYWCNKLCSFMQFLSQDSTMGKFVIDDIRFVNEISFFKALGAKFVRLERSEDAIGKAALDDLSETELDAYDKWDFVLIKELNRNVDDLKKFAEYLADHV